MAGRNDAGSYALVLRREGQSVTPVSHATTSAMIAADVPSRELVTLDRERPALRPA